MPKDTIRILLWVLSFLTFGFATGEFEVTEEKLGVYRPEEHIDNPKVRVFPSNYPYLHSPSPKRNTARRKVPVKTASVGQALTLLL